MADRFYSQKVALVSLNCQELPVEWFYYIATDEKYCSRTDGEIESNITLADWQQYTSIV